MTTTTDAARSDAPANRNANDHCTFCMLAEFDIDRGSTLSYQYPAPSGYDEHMLAELMLPDGVHARTEDWTFFFLKPPGTQRPALRDAAADDDRSSQSHASASASASGSQDPSSWLSDDLTYVINLVRTKHDNTVRRGAMVKAMAIGTRHPFIDVFKPALLLALDDYFQDPGPDCLARLYDSINRLDLSSAPTFSRAEKLVLRASDRRDLFEERFAATPRADPLASNQPASAPAQIEEVETARSTPSNADVSDSVRPRTNSTSTLSSETKSIKKKLSVSSLRPSIGARRGSSANSIAGVPSIPDKRIASSTANSAYRPRDTHFFDTTLVYRSVPLPIRVPLTTFPEEVGEYSLIRLIQTFSGPQSTPTGPVHPHLHINGPSTHPIIILFNALVTQKRVIFLGYGQPAHLVASFVLAACALGSGCGAVLQGFAARAFPYTNLLALDELETVPGYIAGVTNPRFEDLHAWDLLLNVETGRIQVAKDIAPAPTPTNAPSHAMQRSATLPREAAGSNTAFGSVSSATGTDLKTSADADLAQFGALLTNGNGGIGSAIGNGPISSKASSMGGASARDRSNTAQYDTRSDSSNTLFMEELQSAIAAHYGERYIRSRVQEYVFHFVQRVARHEEHFCGRTWLGPACQPFLNGQLGSGPVYADRDSEMREILSNQMRIEGFRRTIAYQLLADKVREFGGWTPAIRSFDLAHQLGRLRRAKKLHVGESDLIFQTIAQGVMTHEQIVEVLALLPPHTGGLLPIATGLFHPAQAVRDAVVDFLLRLCQHPVGRKFVQSMHTYQRLAFARLAQERAEADMRSAQAEVQELTVAMTGLSAQADGASEVRSPTALSSNGSGPRGDSYQSFSPTKEVASTSATALADQNASA